MLNKLKAKFLNRQFLIFGLIGVLNTGIALLLNKFLLALNAEVGVASMIADVLAFIPSYLMNMKWTYHKPYSWKSFLSFPVSYVPGWCITFLLVEILHHGFGVPIRYAKLASVPIYVPVNFIFMSFVVRKTAAPEKRPTAR
ncbi:MAG: GtrA family protein [Bulleidia sp.]